MIYEHFLHVVAKYVGDFYRERNNDFRMTLQNTG